MRRSRRSSWAWRARTGSSTTSRCGTPSRPKTDSPALQHQSEAVDLAAGVAEDPHNGCAVVRKPDVRPAAPRAEPVALVAVRHHQPVAGDLHEDDLEGIQPVRAADNHASDD